MRNISRILMCAVVVTVVLISGSALAGPVEQSCQLLAAIGGNDAAAIDSSLKKSITHWPEANKTSLIKRLRELVGTLKFAGGILYRVAKLGDDIEEYLVLLRLEKGEVAGMRIRYEWGPNEMLLVSINFERVYQKYIKQPFLQAPVKIKCP